MVKQRFIKIMANFVVLAAVTGSASIMTNSSGLATTAPVDDCGSGGSSGGGC
jgi:hypothetical protein